MGNPFAIAMLALKAQKVIELRLVMLAWGDCEACDEAHLMVREKISAALEATVTLIMGGSFETVVARYLASTSPPIPNAFWPSRPGGVVAPTVLSGASRSHRPCDRCSSKCEEPGRGKGGRLDMLAQSPLALLCSLMLSDSCLSLHRIVPGGSRTKRSIPSR
jgi:hypothetical protein